MKLFIERFFISLNTSLKLFEILKIIARTALFNYIDEILKNNLFKNFWKKFVLKINFLSRIILEIYKKIKSYFTYEEWLESFLGCS